MAPPYRALLLSCACFAARGTPSPAAAAAAAAAVVAGTPPPPTPAASAAGKHIVVIGAGFAGLTAACELRGFGYEVTVVDAQARVGGRAQRVSTVARGANGSAHEYAHDAGPSWYWMPEVFEAVLERYGGAGARGRAYNLTRLDPAYSLVLPGRAPLDVPGTADGFAAFAKSLDPAADVAGWAADGAEKYSAGMRAVWSLANPAPPLARWMLSPGLGPSLITRSLRAHLARFTASPALAAVLEWPVKFIGLDAGDAPALYALMGDRRAFGRALSGALAGLRSIGQMALGGSIAGSLA